MESNFNFKCPGYLCLWMDKEAKGNTWPMSLTPTNGEFRVMQEKKPRGRKKPLGVDEVTSRSVKLIWRGKQSIVVILFTFQNKV